MARPEEPPDTPPADPPGGDRASDDLAGRVIDSIKPQARQGARVAKRSVKRALPLFRVAIAMRTAIAAMVAWLVANQMGGDLADYAYAAPLGAFVAVGTTLFTIASTALQQAIGMTVGAVLGMLLIAVEWNGILEIGVIGAVAVLLHGVPRFSGGATVVPVVALLVIIFGGIDADGYAIGYVGQFSLGMAIGVIVNAVAMPALYDKETRGSIREVVDDLAVRIDVLADTMRGDWPPERDDWAGWGAELRATVDELDTQVTDAREARRFNIRMLWNRHDLDVDERAVAALRSVVHRTDSVLDAVSSTAWDHPISINLERDERRLAADAMAALGGHMHAWYDRDGVEAASTASVEAIDALYRRVIEVEEPQSGLASVVFALRAIRERIDWAASQEAEG